MRLNPLIRNRNYLQVTKKKLGGKLLGEIDNLKSSANKWKSNILAKNSLSQVTNESIAIKVTKNTAIDKFPGKPPRDVCEEYVNAELKELTL